MARGAIAYKGQLYLGGSKVEANPTGSATGGNLSKLGVDDIVYAIPQVNNGTLTIKQNGTTKGEFTANQSTDSEVNIEVPNVEETDTTDTTPLLYRQTPHNADGVFLDELVGGSVAWNQFVQNGNFADTSVWSVRHPEDTFTVSNNVASFTPSANGDRFVSNNIQMVVGHKYILIADGKASNGNAEKILFYVFYGSANDNYAIPVVGDEKWHTVTKMFICSSNNYNFVRLQNAISGSTNQYRNVYCIDLTQMFGTTISDYVYTLEQATAGSGIAWLKSHGFFTKDYYPYNTGELISVKTSGKKYVGFNQWDEEWEVGDISTSTGQNISGQQIRSKNYISVLSNETYCFTDKRIAAEAFRIFEYDDNKNFITQNLYNTASYIKTFSVSNNCTYIRFIIGSGYGIVYNNNVCINISKPTGTPKNGDYVPYEEHTYDISNIDLRGIPKLVNNEIVYDGDTYESNGNVTRKYGIVDLGEVYWSRTTTNTFHTAIDGSYNGKKFGLYICPKYVATSKSYAVLDNGEMTNNPSGIDSSRAIIVVKDTNYDDRTAFTTAMSGVYLIYELATPTTETTDPYTSPQICDKDGTEEFIDDRTVPIPVGHNSRYADLPAMMDGDYLSYMARNFASEEYVDRRMDALGDLAYINEDGDNSTKFLRGDGTWQNTPAGVTTLAALTDTTISSPSNGQVLKYDGSKWVNSADYSLPTASAGTLGGVKVGTNLSIDANGVLSATGGGANALKDLTDVSAASPLDKQVLAYDSSQSKWVAVDADVVAIPRSYWSSTTRELDFMITVPAYNTQRILKFSLMHAAGLAASEYMFALDRGDVYSSKMAGDTCGISSSYSSSTYTYTITITMPSVSGSPNFIFAMTMYNGSDKTW